MAQLAPKYKRFIFLLGLLGVAILGVFFALKGFREEVAYFKKPSEFKLQRTLNQKYRIGGIVKAGSLQYDYDNLDAYFILTDEETDVTIHYVGILPDLFREDQVVVVEGEFPNPRQFEASTVLAKHDENYKPRPLQD